jgi:hypothetical protein
VLVAKADDVGLVMSNGRRLDCPQRARMLHDDSGKVWPACSILIASIRRGRREATDDEFSGDAQSWLGKDYVAHVGSFDPPPRDLSQWKYVGDVKKIYYVRYGTKAPGQFKHRFNRARGLYHIVAIINGKREVKLYRRGRMYRLELGGGCLVSSLGLVWP